MIERLRLWHGALTPRERVLVAIAAALAVVTLGWGVAIAMRAATDSAASRYDRAVRALAETRARVAALRDLAGAPMPGEPIDAVLRQRALSAGFTLSADAPDGEGAVAFAIASARPSALFPWLATIERDGLVIQRFSVSDNGNGTVAVRATVRRRGA